MPSWKVFKGSSDGNIIESTTEKGDVQGDQVLIKVTASGLCGTDLHYKTVDMVLVMKVSASSKQSALTLRS